MYFGRLEPNFFMWNVTTSVPISMDRITTCSRKIDLWASNDEIIQPKVRRMKWNTLNCLANFYQQQ
jgi:hypothetical protein